eukprot:6212071-Pleurochrysis_carterae.AAC.3
MQLPFRVASLAMQWMLFTIAGLSREMGNETPIYVDLAWCMRSKRVTCRRCCQLLEGGESRNALQAFGSMAAVAMTTGFTPTDGVPTSVNGVIAENEPANDHDVGSDISEEDSVVDADGAEEESSGEDSFWNEVRRMISRFHSRASARHLPTPPTDSFPRPSPSLPLPLQISHVSTPSSSPHSLPARNYIQPQEEIRTTQYLYFQRALTPLSRKTYILWADMDRPVKGWNRQTPGVIAFPHILEVHLA